MNRSAGGVDAVFVTIGQPWVRCVAARERVGGSARFAFAGPTEEGPGWTAGASVDPDKRDDSEVATEGV